MSPPFGKKFIEQQNVKEVGLQEGQNFILEVSTKPHITK